jgi:hypothetical protein
MSHDHGKFRNLNQWKEEAKYQPTSFVQPDPNLVVKALPPNATIGPQDAKGRQTITLHGLTGRDGQATHTRHFLTVHAAIVAVCMLAGGSIDLRGGGGGGNTENWHPQLILHGTTVQLNRILYDAVGEMVRERSGPGIDFHFIGPSTHFIHQQRGRAWLLATVAEHDAALAALLRDLFDIANNWHGHELERVGDDDFDPGDEGSPELG